MKTTQYIIMTLLAVLLLACSEESPYEPDYYDPSDTPITPSGGSSSTATATIGELTSFTIDVDSTTLDEDETINVNDEDYIENNTFDNEIGIHYDGNSATVSGEIAGVSIAVSGGHVTVVSTVKGVCYTLDGSTSNGSFKLYGENKYAIRLAGVSITNPTGAAINSQCKKRGYIQIADATWNTLQDGDAYDTTADEDMKATLFSEGKLLFSGTGHLRVLANCKGGIASDDYILFRPGNNIYIKNSSSNGIKANDAIVMRGGVINVECTGVAAKGMKCEGNIQIDGGRFTAITTGGGEWDSEDNDVNGCAGIKCDSVLTVNGGIICVKSTGQGGKGISGDGVMYFNGGSIKVITTGRVYSYGSYSTSPKGIKGDSDIYLAGSRVMVRSTGGENSEGIESKGKIYVSDGQVEVYSYDDAINAKGQIAISGGSVFAYATNNDGLDSNGTIAISGGTVVACGTTAPEEGIDCDQSSFTITGGTILGIGGTTSTPSSSSTQPIAIVGGNSLNTGTHIALAGNDGGNIYAFAVPRSYNSYTLLVSSPLLTRNGKCTLTTGATVSGGNSFDGLITGGAVTGGTALASLTLSNIVTTYNFNNTQPGGGGGRGW